MTVEGTEQKLAYEPRRLTDEQQEQLCELLRILAANDVDDAIVGFMMEHSEKDVPRVDQVAYDDLVSKAVERYVFPSDPACGGSLDNVWPDGFDDMRAVVDCRLESMRRAEMSSVSFEVPTISGEDYAAYTRVVEAKLYRCIAECQRELNTRTPTQAEAEAIVENLMDGDCNLGNPRAVKRRIAAVLTEPVEAA